jgi:hypothetical protein
LRVRFCALRKAKVLPAVFYLVMSQFLAFLHLSFSFLSEQIFNIMNYLKNKQNLLLLMFICLSISAFGQNMYVSANVGYGIGISPLPFNNYAPIKGSLGKGTSINTAFGFVFGKHLGAELNISYLIGEKSGIQTNSTQLNIDNNFSARMLNLMPSLVIRTGEKKMKPYA